MRRARTVIAGIAAIALGAGAPVAWGNSCVGNTSYSDDQIQSFCRYLEEGGVEEAMDLMDVYLRQGQVTDALSVGLLGFEPEVLDMTIQRKPEQPLCRYKVSLKSELCEFQYAKMVGMDERFFLDESGDVEKLSLFTRADFLSGAEAVSSLNDRAIAYQSMLTFMQVMDREYVVAVTVRDDVYSASLLEIPKTDRCYDIDFLDVNADGKTDLVLYEPHVWAISGGADTPSSYAFCSDGAGRFSGKRCDRPVLKPPHLRIHHEY